MLVIYIRYKKMRDTLLAYGAFGFFIMILVLFAFIFFGPDGKNFKVRQIRESQKFFWGSLLFLSILMVIVFVLSFTV